jgi:hypothetical protein
MNSAPLKKEVEGGVSSQATILNTLSDKIYLQAPGSVRLPNSLAVEDVKEAVKRLKECAKWNRSGIIGQSITAELNDLIDEIFGSKLIENEKGGKQ